MEMSKQIAKLEKMSSMEIQNTTFKLENNFRNLMLFVNLEKTD